MLIHPLYMSCFNRFREDLMKTNEKKYVLYFFLLLMIIAALAAFSGCTPTGASDMRLVRPDPSQNLMPNTAKPSLKDRPMVNPVLKSMPPQEGSLWSEDNNMLFTDNRARHVGDTVVVDIVENTTSSISANTTAKRDSSISAGIPHMLGYMRAAEALRPNLNRDKDGNLVDKLIEGSMTNDFTGEGASDRSGQITASIGARILEILPNGNLVLYGRREMRINNDSQFITVSGIVREKDITSDNRIQSTYLADAVIEYTGKGVLADKQKPGWGSRILDNIWPF